MMPEEYPRLHSPEPPHVPVTTYAFIGQRFPFGPCTVHKQIRIDGEDEGRVLVLPEDWADPTRQNWLAREMLRMADCDNDGDRAARFASEVIARLPREGWELPFAEVKAWSERNYPAPVLPPRPSLEDLSEQALWELGLLDEEGGGGG
jgi:hypothetical protein